MVDVGSMVVPIVVSYDLYDLFLACSTKNSGLSACATTNSVAYGASPHRLVTFLVRTNVSESPVFVFPLKFRLLRSNMVKHSQTLKTHRLCPAIWMVSKRFSKSVLVSAVFTSLEWNRKQT